jgi:sugar/nucleoside kinase (ribokinase family)
LIVGSIGLDTIKTPFGEKKDILGGSAIHASTSASFFCPTTIVGPLGEDFPKEYISFLKQRNIDLSNLKRMKGKTFRWNGYYEYDMNQAHTRDTQLNVLAEFDPSSDIINKFPFVFLANLDPSLQLKVLADVSDSAFVVADTMDFWIARKKDELLEVVTKVDYMLMNEGELRQLMETPNIPLAASRLLKLGAKGVVVKKGEHGALLFQKNTHFAAPSYPQEELKDPTGAGDSFAGGFMGYITKTGDLSDANIRRAIIMGSVMASYNVEDFSVDRLRRLRSKEIISRFDDFKRISHFETLSETHLV